MEAETNNVATTVAEDTAEKAQEKLEAQLNALIRDPLLTHIRNLKAPWAKLKESDQQDVIGAVEEMARSVIRQACSIIAKRGFDSLGIQLKDLAIKDGRIKGKFEASMTAENVQLLAEHENTTATIVLIDPASFMQGEWAKAEPDQPEIPLEGGENAEEEADEDGVLPDTNQRRVPRRAKAAA